MKKLIVVIPARNEEELISEVIEKIPRDIEGINTYVIVMDDGSTDQTARIARRAGADVVYSFKKNRGLGAVVREGLKTAYFLGADVAVMIDADNEYPAEEIPNLIYPILQGEADYVMGSRFKGTIHGMKWHRKLANISFTLLQSILLRQWIWDGQSGLRAFRKEVLRDLDIVHDYNYAQVMTLNIVRKGYRMREVPISYKVRKSGESFIKGSEYLRRVFPAIVKEMGKKKSKG